MLGSSKDKIIEQMLNMILVNQISKELQKRFF